MQALITKLTDKRSQQFADQIGNLFKSFPHLPKSITGFLVKITPILVLIGAVLGLFASPVLALLGVLSFLTLNPFFVFSVFAAAVLSVAMSVILLLAYNPLRKHQYAGWMLLFWSNVLGALSTLFGIGTRHNGVGSLISLVIGFYILFEVRGWYKGK